jgi:predicted GIY-YIG superfamily endonuclease
MHYVYILQTDDLRKRLPSHNTGRVAQAPKWKPWPLKTYVAFPSRTHASDFEQFLKSASGPAFARKRL